MKLIANWKRVLRKAWSVRLILLAGIMSGVELVFPFFSDAMPRGLFALLAGAFSCGAFVARMLAQKSVSDDE